MNRFPHTPARTHAASRDAHEPAFAHHHYRPLGIALAAVLGLAVATSVAAAGAETAEADILAMDKDGNGVLTSAEHAAGTRTLFTTMDADGNGRVTVDEMDRFAQRQAVREDRRQPAADRVRRVDGDQDGSVTADEHAAASRQAFEAMDTNRDGMLDKAELAVGHAKHLKGPAGH